MVDLATRWRSGGASGRAVARALDSAAGFLALPREPLLYRHGLDAAARGRSMARLRALALGLPPRADRARAVPAGARRRSAAAWGSGCSPSVTASPSSGVTRSSSAA